MVPRLQARASIAMNHVDDYKFHCHHRLHGAPFRVHTSLPGDPVTSTGVYRRYTRRSIWCSRATGNRAPNPKKPVKQYPVPAARCAPPLPSAHTCRGTTAVDDATTTTTTIIVIIIVVVVYNISSSCTLCYALLKTHTHRYIPYTHPSTSAHNI